MCFLDDVMGAGLLSGYPCLFFRCRSAVISFIPAFLLCHCDIVSETGAGEGAETDRREVKKGGLT